MNKMTHESHAPNNPHHLDSLGFELGMLAAKRYAGLLPKNKIPLSWLQELTTVECPALATHPNAWPVLVDRLETSGVLRVADDPTIEIRTAGDGARAAVESMHEQDVKLWRNRLRQFASTRLETNRAEAQCRINRVMTGDPETPPTAWTVPSIDVVKARAAGDARVAIVEFGDGTYSVRLTSTHCENDCLKALADQEFAGHDLDGIVWALHTNLLTSEQLTAAEERIGKGYVHDPNNAATALAAGLYWLKRAYRWYADGWSSRTSWTYCGTAVNIFKQLQERHPEDPTVAELLAEAKKAEWTYDD